MGSLISIYPTLGAEHLSQRAFFYIFCGFGLLLAWSAGTVHFIAITLLNLLFCFPLCLWGSTRLLVHLIQYKHCGDQWRGPLAQCQHRQRGRKAHSTTDCWGRICYYSLLIRCEIPFLFILLFTHTGTCEDERAYNQQRRGHSNF